jgi:hypothetical protein
MEKQLLEKYVRLRKELESVEDRAKYLRNELETATLNLINHLQDNCKEATARYEDLGYLTLAKPRVYASVNADQEQALFKFLKKHKKKSKNLQKILRKQVFL